MKTMIGMVTIGKASAIRQLAVRRAQAYAERQGYEFAQITTPILADAQRTPHWQKTLVPRAYPGYERYLVIDDDLLINHRSAPPLPEIAPGTIGLVREPLPYGFSAPVEWVGNTGFMLVDRGGLDLLEKAYARGEYRGVPPGFGDQPAVNAVAWEEGRVSRLDWKWNYMLMADWMTRVHRASYPWPKSKSLARLGKATLMLRLLMARFSAPSGAVLGRLREAYMIHLTWFKMGAGAVDRFLGA